LYLYKVHYFIYYFILSLHIFWLNISSKLLNFKLAAAFYYCLVKVFGIIICYCLIMKQVFKLFFYIELKT